MIELELLGQFIFVQFTIVDINFSCIFGVLFTNNLQEWVYIPNTFDEHGLDFEISLSNRIIKSFLIFFYIAVLVPLLHNFASLKCETNAEFSKSAHIERPNLRVVHFVKC